jgi:hypothetical protein
LTTLSTAFFGPCSAMVEVEVGPGHGGDGGAVVVVAAGREQVDGEQGQRQPALQGTGAGLLQHRRVAGEHEHRLAEHRQ